MKFSYSIAAAALLGASAALAQTASTSSSSSSSIPTDISDSCRTFLAELNTDTAISSCTEPLVAATKLYSATATNSSTSNTSNDLDSTLTSLCGDNNGCDPDLIRSKLDSFWQQCHTDIQQGRSKVRDYYDNLYMITPLKNAICSRDSANTYCLKTIAKQAASTSIVGTKRSLAASHHELAKRQAASTAASSSSDDTIDELSDSVDEEASIAGINNTNTAFLFLSEKTPKSILCSECSENILAAYIQFETSIPYGIGLRNSDKLGVQSSIFAAFQKTCGSSAVTKVNTMAGTKDIAKIGAGARDVQAASLTLTAVAASVVGAVMML